MIRKHRAMLTLGALSIVLSFGMRSAEAQGVTEYVTVSTACNQLNQTAIKQVDDGRLQEVETTISAALATSKDVGPSCVGLVLNNWRLRPQFQGGLLMPRGLQNGLFMLCRGHHRHSTSGCCGPCIPLQGCGWSKERKQRPKKRSSICDSFEPRTGTQYGSSAAAS
jgi:hypothetical protein